MSPVPKEVSNLNITYYYTDDIMGTQEGQNLNVKQNYIEDISDTLGG